MVKKKIILLLKYFKIQVKILLDLNAILIKLVDSQYFTFIDDDDVSLEYITHIMDAILSYDVDVITFQQRCSLDGGQTYFTVDSDLDNIDDEIPLGGPWNEEYKRGVWHWNIFRSQKIKEIEFGFGKTLNLMF